MKTKVPLLVFALFLPLAFGAWKWVNVLERRSEQRLNWVKPLQLSIKKGTSGLVKFNPPLNDAFVLSITDLSGYQGGHEHEVWQMEQLQFRPSVKQPWKTLPRISWRSQWFFFQPRDHSARIGTERRRTFSLWGYRTTRSLLVGQYRIHVYVDQEFSDKKSNIRYLGTGRSNFAFHVNSVLSGKEQVILDSVQKVD